MNYKYKYKLYTYVTWSEKLLLEKDIKKYHFVSQGKTEIAGVDDKEEHLITDVSIGVFSATWVSLTAGSTGYMWSEQRFIGSHTTGAIATSAGW